MLKVLVVKDYDALSKEGAEIIAKTIKENEKPVLGLATGSSPIGTYKELIKKYEAGELNIRASVIIELRKIYKCSYDEFFVGLDNI